ncbi:RNA polymerase sigma factor [Pseudoxanthomonas sp. 10H]|uniref:RNA polymerase sigma factor n=1 Tax=Pseudoxanthomonas sp. 10H TaxID=3242729 RepID=UPI003556B6BD
MDRTAYAALLAQARRLSRNAAEAADLVQETLRVAVEQGRTDPRADGAWLAGVMRRQAALRARTEMRRRRREADWAGTRRDRAMPEEPGLPPQRILQALPPASRRLAVLVLHGLDAGEVRWILRLDPASLRQRIVRLRRALQGLDADARHAVSAAASRAPVRAADLAFGPLRRALKAALRGQALGTHDPDGHLIVVRGGHA